MRLPGIIPVRGSLLAKPHAINAMISCARYPPTVAVLTLTAAKPANLLIVHGIHFTNVLIAMAVDAMVIFNNTITFTFALMGKLLVRNLHTIHINIHINVVPPSIA